MSDDFSRRDPLCLVGAGTMGLLGGAPLASQQPPEPRLKLPPDPIVPIARRSTVSLVKKDARRKNCRLHSDIERHLQWMGPMTPDPGFGRGQRRRGA